MEEIGNIGIIISGPITAGKSTLAEEISKELNIPLINETTKGNYFNILDHMNPFYYPTVIFDHCWIHRKWYILKSLYRKSFIFILNPSDTLLKQNYEKRKENTTVGDFLKIDPLAQNEEILKDCVDIKNKYDDGKDHKLVILNIKDSSSYGEIKKIIVNTIKAIS